MGGPCAAAGLSAGLVRGIKVRSPLNTPHHVTQRSLPPAMLQSAPTISLSWLGILTSEFYRIPLEGMPKQDSGLRVSSLTTVVSDSPDKSTAIAVALCRSDSARAEGCGVMVYGSGLNVDCNVMDIGSNKQWLPSSEPPIVLKSFSYIFPMEPSKIGRGASDLPAPKNALLVFGSSGNISAYVRSPNDEFAPVPKMELGCLPEIEVLSEAGPFSSMDVRYVFFQRHVAAGGLRGAVVYTSVDVTSGTMLSSRRITIEGPITSCLLFSSSRHLDAAQIPPPDLAVCPSPLSTWPLHFPFSLPLLHSLSPSISPLPHPCIPSLASPPPPCRSESSAQLWAWQWPSRRT